MPKIWQLQAADTLFKPLLLILTLLRSQEGPAKQRAVRSCLIAMLEDSVCTVRAAAAHCPAATEKRIVALIWVHIENLLASGTVDAAVRDLAMAFPDPCSLSSAELPELAKLHVNSAHNLMATLRLLAPAAFACGSSQQPDLNALDEADSGLLGMAANLVELQLFHLQRAATLTAAARKRLAQQQRAAEQQATPDSSTCSCCSPSSAASPGSADQDSTMTSLSELL